MAAPTDYPPMGNWSSVKQIGKRFGMDHSTVRERLLRMQEEKVIQHNTEYEDGLKTSKEIVTQRYIGERNLRGVVVLAASPQAVADFELQLPKPVPDGWRNAYDLSKEFQGDKQAWGIKLASLQAELLREHKEEGGKKLVQEKYIGMYRGKAGRVTLFVSPLGVEKILQQEIPVLEDNWISINNLSLELHVKAEVLEATALSLRGESIAREADNVKGDVKAATRDVDKNLIGMRKHRTGGLTSLAVSPEMRKKLEELLIPLKPDAWKTGNQIADESGQNSTTTMRILQQLRSDLIAEKLAAGMAEGDAKSEVENLIGYRRLKKGTHTIAVSPEAETRLIRYIPPIIEPDWIPFSQICKRSQVGPYQEAAQQLRNDKIAEIAQSGVDIAMATDMVAQTFMGDRRTRAGKVVFAISPEAASQINEKVVVKQTEGQHVGRLNRDKTQRGSRGE